jgi:FHA domain
MDHPDRSPDRLALIELQGRDGRVGQAVDVRQWPLTLGRALDNHIVIDDPHVAPHHARLVQAEGGGVLLVPLPSLNGVRVDGRRATTDVALPPGGAELQLGGTRLRLRLAGEVLAPELPLPPGGRGGLLTPLLLGLAVLALVLAEHWISLDPGADYSAWLPAAVGLPVALAGWCGLWALMSKLFQHRFDFTGHLRIVVPWLLGMTVAEIVLPQAGAALALPLLWKLNAPLQALLAALILRAHLNHVLPQHSRAVNLSMAALVVAGSALSLASTWRATHSLSPSPYMSTLPLPALRLTGTVPSAALVQELEPVARQLAERVKKQRQDDADESGEPDE